MHLDGKHTLNASRNEIWKLLMDPEVLARVTPGVKSLEPTEEDKYNATFEIKMGPVSGTFKGKMEIAEKNSPQSFKLKMRVNGKIGNVAAEGKLGLEEISANQTEVSFSGDAKMTGTLARTGQRVMSGVAKTMTQQFFQALEQETRDVSEAASDAAVSGLWARIKAWFARLFGN